MWGLGVSYNSYTKALFRGWFLQPGLSVGEQSSWTEDRTVKAKLIISHSANAGYRWTWRGFSLALGAGLSHTIGEFKDTDRDGTNYGLVFDTGFVF